MVLKGGKNYKAVPTDRHVNVDKSPFFRPSDPRHKLRPVSTPGGTTRLQKLPPDKEVKSTIFGASANLVVSIVGAGIVGVPYAIKQSGLMAGIFMTLFCAVITEKTLRLLIETAKHISAPSYEVLFEASFGRIGFISMSSIMFLMSYGAMVGYLMVVKDILSSLLGVDSKDVLMRRTVLVVVTLTVLFPMCCQRDMAQLAKTSKVSVVFYFIMVLFVVVYSPVQENVNSNGGWTNTIFNDIINPKTFFEGLGVLSFAYVCQHSAFIIAGSLHHPTKERWSVVSRSSLLFCGMLATVMGTIGYLGFGDATVGNILNNFHAISSTNGGGGGSDLEGRLANATRALLVMCMFFVYPMDAFVSRHVAVVLLFKGRRAHEGDDHAVLARKDRRILLTAVIYLITLLPAILVDDLGLVLAITGAVAGSILSYIAPGISYLAVHGEEFLRMLNERWTWGNPSFDADETIDQPHYIARVVGRILWYITFMPVWTLIARVGKHNVDKFLEEEALKSPMPNRLGRIVRPKNAALRKDALPPPHLVPPSAKASDMDDFDDASRNYLVRTNSMPGKNIVAPLDLETSAAITDAGAGYGSIPPSTGRLISTMAVKKQSTIDDDDDEEPENDPQDNAPKLYDFLVAIFFVAFGAVAMVVGLWSILNDQAKSG